MLHTFAHRHEAASLYECCLALIELTALPEIKFTGDEGHDLIHGMGVRRDPAVGRELHAQDERTLPWTDRLTGEPLERPWAGRAVPPTM